MNNEDKFSLDTHIKVHDAGTVAYIEVCPAPDGFGLITVRTNQDRISSEVYGSWELLLVRPQAELLCKAIEKTIAQIKFGFERGFTIPGQVYHISVLNRVYDDTNGVYIQVEPDDDNESIRLRTTDNGKCIEWYGPIDIELSQENVSMLVAAIRSVAADLPS